MSCECEQDDKTTGHHWKHGDHHGRGHSGDGHGGGCRCRCGCDCGDGHGGGDFRRRFVSRAERVEKLEHYLRDLEAEAEAVREQIAEMKKSRSK